MSNCNATIEVGGETLPCTYAHSMDGQGHAHKGPVTVFWHDGTRGAKPHIPSRFRVAQTTDAWVVVQGQQTVATFSRDHFPGSAFHAAKAEAARLNGEDDVQHAVDLAFARGDAQRAARECDQARGERDRARRERDACRAALEKIAATTTSRSWWMNVQTARDVLEGT